MQITSALINAGLQVFPCWIRYNEAKQKYEKGPAVPKGVSWQSVNPQDPRLDWSSGTIGIAVPPGVVVLDIDSQKGVTLADVEAFLGVHLNWDAALLQQTPSGGAHYAFRTNRPIKQSVDWIPGFDTRTAGVGFICAGNLYPMAGNFGPMALTQPGCLPELPTGTVLEATEAPVRDTPDLPDPTTRDEKSLIDALRFLDPTPRDVWVTVGMGLRNYYHDDPEAGFALFDAWSRGEYWADGQPDSYNADTQHNQWLSFKPTKGGKEVRIGTLFHMAIVKGWVPPRNFDTAAAFGGSGASAEKYDAAVDEILAIGGDPKQAEAVVGMIQRLDGSVLQRAMLGALLKRQLKEDGLLTKELTGALDLMIGVKGDTNIQGIYGKNHSQNAILFLDTNYPDATLVRVHETWYAYNGKVWVELEDDKIIHQIALALAPISPQNATISGTYSLVAAYTYRDDLVLGDVPDNLILMQNGILDINTLELMAHDKRLFTTNILPYSYNPAATCPRWLAFLEEITGCDYEIIDLLQEWFGYMLSSDYKHQKIFFMLGPKRCGKGTIGRILNRLVGDQNFTGGDVADLLENKFLETLPGKTVFFDGDVRKSFSGGAAEPAAKKLKTISGNDRIAIPRLYKKPLNLYLPTRFTLAGNHVPRLFDDSGALASRIMVMPLYRSFIDKEDLTLFDKLVCEIEGIANWALGGLMRLNQVGRFTRPAASASEAQQISEQYSPIKTYVDGQLQLGGDSFISARDLYEHYRAWALDEGEEIMTRRPFTSSIKDLTRGQNVSYGPTRTGPDDVERGFTGIAIKNNDPRGTAGAFKPAPQKE